MMRTILVSTVLAAMLVAATPAVAAPYLTKREARSAATHRVKKEMRKDDGDYYEIDRCYRYSRVKVGCDYYYEYYDDYGDDAYCEGRMMVVEHSRYYNTFGRHVICDNL